MAPGTVVAVRLIGWPTHTGLLLEANGDAGTGRTITLVVATALLQASITARTEYTPALANVTIFMVGFWSVDVKPLGPVHK